MVVLHNYRAPVTMYLVNYYNINNRVTIEEN